MAGSSQTGLPQLFSELHRCCQNQEYNRVIQVANRIIQDSPQDVDAFRCKILAMIYQNAFNDALTLMNKNAMGKSMVFEKAYAEYRLNRMDEALRTLTSIQQDNLSAAELFRRKELEAQIYYRIERFEDCLQIYRQLVKEADDEYEDERLTNISAVAASLNLSGNQGVASSVESIINCGEKTYEKAFNMAFKDISDGNYVGAEGKLRESDEICQQAYEDDIEALEEERVVIKTQLAFVLQMQGRTNEACNLYNSVLKQRSSDAAVLAVASNNIVTLNRDQNIFDSKKKIKTATATELNHKLLSKQQTAIALNHALLLMYSGQGDICRKVVRQLLQKGTKNKEELTFVLVATALREKKIEEAISTLSDFISSNNSKSEALRSSLALVQLYLQQGSVSQAIDALKTLDCSLCYRPGIVATVVALLKNLEDKEAAVDYLDAAVTFNRKENSMDSASLEVLMRETASAMLAIGQNARAVVILEELRRIHPKDMRVLAQLITAYAAIEPIMAQEVSQDLPSPEEMAQGVDVDTLEAHCFASGPKYNAKRKDADKVKEGSPIVGKATELIQTTKNKRRKRKGKLPKNYDPKVDPDPERWLPRKDRSTYKGRRRDKRKEGVGKGTQGGVGIVDGLDASKPLLGAVPKASSPQAVSTPVGGKAQVPQPTNGAKTQTGQPKAQQKKQQQKKKKKGGW